MSLRIVVSPLKVKKQKIKSKRGGNVDVIVSKRVSWPHDTVLGGSSRQCMSYNQLTWCQWVQVFARNILEEKSKKTRENMLNYLSDLMEDANDFSWHGAKAAYAVLMCDMERVAVIWDDTARIDLGGLAPKNMFKISKPSAKMVRWLTRGHGFVNYTSQVPVHLQKTMRAMVNYTDTSVPIV